MKILIAGPKSVGKTIISNFLANQTEKIIADKYSPTVGVRILEYDIKLPGVPEQVNVELWDASGDYTYEACWRAIMHEADGVLLVYNPDAPGQDQQIGEWFEYFVRKNGLKDVQCLLFAHRQNTSTGAEKFRPPSLFSRITSLLTTQQNDREMKDTFENFLKEVHNTKSRG